METSDGSGTTVAVVVVMVPLSEAFFSAGRHMVVVMAKVLLGLLLLACSSRGSSLFHETVLEKNSSCSWTVAGAFVAGCGRRT